MPELTADEFADDLYQILRIRAGRDGRLTPDEVMAAFDAHVLAATNPGDLA